jgi:hypothetical protein
MRSTLSIFFLLFAVAPVVAQQSEVRQVGPFKGVKAYEAISVTLKKGDKESVKIEVERVPLSAVLTEVSGNYLKIHMADGKYNERKVRVEVTYVTIEKVSASSAAEILSEGTLKAATLDVAAASAASIELTIEAGTVTADVASAGDVILEGKAKSLLAETASAGVLDAYNLECETVDVTAGSAGTAKVSASKEIRANASSAGSIRYRGNPSKSDTRSGSGGSVRKTD